MESEGRPSLVLERMGESGRESWSAMGGVKLEDERCLRSLETQVSRGRARLSDKISAAQTTTPFVPDTDLAACARQEHGLRLCCTHLAWRMSRDSDSACPVEGLWRTSGAHTQAPTFYCSRP